MRQILTAVLLAAAVGCTGANDSERGAVSSGKADAPFLSEEVDLTTVASDLPLLRALSVGHYALPDWDDSILDSNANVLAIEGDWKLAVTVYFGDQTLDLELIYDIRDHEYYGFINQPTDEPGELSVEYAYAQIWEDGDAHFEFGFRGVRNADSVGGDSQLVIANTRMIKY